MINKHQINTKQAMYAIQNGEFNKDLIASKDKTVIVLTQDWCSQWKNMKSWIYEIETDEDIDIYQLEYNKVDYFDMFRSFKESHWGNHEVPYLRFYKAGELIKETNYIDKLQFVNIIVS